MTSLRRSAPLVLLNVSLGDAAVLEWRSCGCPLEGVGWGSHLREIRSHEKLTACGVNLLDVDVVRVLEEDLPDRFGGGPTDYQLVEDEAEDGRPRLRLLVDPRVGEMDGAAVAEAFLSAVGPGSGGEWIMSRIWRDGRIVQVERRPPLRTGSGKIHHLARSVS